MARKSTKGKTIPAGTSKLDVLLNEGAETLRELKRLDENRKLTFDAFCEEAMKIACVDEKRLEEVEKIIAEQTGTDSIRAFIRRLAKEFSEPQYVRPFDDPSKAVRIFGGSDLDGQLGQHGIRAPEVQCLAVQVCFERFGGEVFGTVVDFAQHEAETEKLRARLDKLYGKMEDVVSGADFVIDNSRLLPDEKKRGLAKVVFRRAPGINYGTPAWPRLLVEDAERPIPIAEHKTPRRQLDDAAMAAI